MNRVDRGSKVVESRLPPAERGSRDTNKNAKQRRAQRISPLWSSFHCVLGSTNFLAKSAVLNLRRANVTLPGSQVDLQRLMV
jgi:hypothetical protein